MLSQLKEAYCNSSSHSFDRPNLAGQKMIDSGELSSGSMRGIDGDALPASIRERPQVVSGSKTAPNLSHQAQRIKPYCRPRLNSI